MLAHQLCAHLSWTEGPWLRRPVWWCLTLCSCEAQTSSAETMWQHAASTNVLLLPPRSPQTWSICGNDRNKAWAHVYYIILAWTRLFALLWCCISQWQLCTKVPRNFVYPWSQYMGRDQSQGTDLAVSFHSMSPLSKWRSSSISQNISCGSCSSSSSPPSSLPRMNWTLWDGGVAVNRKQRQTISFKQRYFPCLPELLVTGI